jgi:TonB-linked SusC/RagA family outer membrane protein
MIMDYEKSSLNFSSSVKIGWKNHVKVTLLLFTFLFGSYNFTYAKPNDNEAEEYHLKNDLTNAFSKTSTKGNQSKQENSAQLTLTGNVTDDTGSPLPGATVIEIGSSNGVITDFDGGFTLSVSGPEAAILVSYLGFDSVQILASDFGDQTNISLTESASALDEIVITGYGRQVKRNITGAVSSISAKQIEDLPLASFENAIQGQMAGVQVTEPSGEPGAGATVRVRGIGSISAGNEPLYVVDGFPISKNVDLGVQGDNFRRGSGRFRPPTQNPLANLNPNDIESIQVLKDASTASIYGSRGSNGVVIITTKRGKKGGAPSFSYNTFVGTQTVANRLDLMNSAELIEYNKEATNNAYLQNGPAGASTSDPNSVRTNGAWRLAEDVLNPSGVDNDWQDTLFRSALVQTHNLSVSGGSDNSSYFISGNYFDQDGIIEKSNFKRYSLRVNLEVDLNDRTRVGLNLAPSYIVSDKVPAGSPYFARPPGIVYSGIVHAPFVKPYNPDGSINQLNNQSYILTPAGQSSSFTSASNPLAIIQAVDDRLNQNRTFGNIFMEYDLTSDLIFKSYFGVDVNNYSRNFYRASSLLYRTSSSGETYGQTSSSNSLSWVAEQTLNYNKEIGSHRIDALVGYTAQKERINISTAVADNFPDDLVKTISGGQISQGTAVQEEWSLVSMLAKVNYSYKDRFLATASLRSDTSSRFGKGNKTGIFPALSAGYRISEDIGADWLSDLKLRASWGQTGNFLIPNYASIGLLSTYNTTFDGTLTNGIAPSTISNQDLSWEKTSSVDIGLDFGFLNDRIYGSFEYFESTTTDLLLAVQIPSALGFTNALTNIGEVVNKGFEISLTSRNLVGELKWTTDFNFSTINNEVTKLGPSGDPILSSGAAGNRHITKIGEAVGSYYGYQTNGIYQNQAEIDNSGIVDQVATPRPGDFKWVDVNEDGFINSADRTVIGNYLPDFTYGMNNRFEYRDFEFSFLLQGVEGNEVLNLTRRHMGNGEANYNSYSEWNNRWRSEAQPGNGSIPRANRQTGNSNNRPSSYQVEDASYLRLRNVTLAYNFPQNELGGKIEDLRLYLSGTNLFTKTDYLGFNPEVNNQDDNTNVQGEDYGAYPLSSVITIGINAKF